MQPLRVSNLVGGSGHGFGFRRAVPNEAGTYTEWRGDKAARAGLQNNILCDLALTGFGMWWEIQRNFL
jgi:hypothetical protein